MKLLEAQCLFFDVVCSKLAPKVLELGLRANFGETYRNEELEKAAQALGLSNLKPGTTGTHELRLGIDLNLYRVDATGKFEWLTTKEAFQPLGDFWESLSTPEITFCWGGHWGDDDHFSIKWGGVK